ncbi:other scy1 protein kinase [Ceraceosorus bombacis]|uniref:Other scy1 protein kinase n=1 Tax=Ceraceosorus bombacis TaxID=401625 RepID=A0A0P1BHU3_9BASI|nr:other scy1 protein kinase [Ceraceosorus bombacis]
MASFLSQASSYFGRTNISANYTVDEKIPAVYAGLWKIQRAHRSGSAPANGAGPSSSAGGATSDGRTTVSIWTHTFTSRGGERQAIAETLKKEASSLTRLRHPCVLETQEPLEETRNELIFATEPVLAPLSEALLASESSGRASDNVQLDEVEIQKGLLQVARGLEFLHSAKMIHGNLTPDAILINAKGDWKLGGFSFLTPVMRPDGTPSPCILDYDPSLPPQLSRDFNFVAPEYALDDKLDSGNDMYSLGCVVYAIHNRGDPPFRNRNAVANIRSNADLLGSIIGSASWAKMSKDVLGLLASLLTRFPGGRPSAADFQNSDNVLVRTLKFMERDNFAGRSREERVQFLKGLLKILEQFSQRLQRRKVLPALLELMNDRSLLPFILPNVFVISTNLSSIEFTNNVLPKLKPLFSLQDPPQNQLILLDQMELFVSKTSPPVFREEVTPLLYSALEAEQVIVQERALQTVPRLCQVLEYAHVKEVTYPALVKLFVGTRTLSCKIQTLMCFHSMIDILDKHTITEKLVPVLARVKTREPSVMIAILAVDEAMSKKLDRETLAVHIIPQLWSMSVSAKLTAEQFQRFMKTVREMGDRVEREHLEYLREQRHLQDQTESYASANGAHQSGGLGGGVTGIGGSTGEIDFATLVGSAAGGNSSSALVAKDAGTNAGDPFGWDDL